jgi:penicillin amidase
MRILKRFFFYLFIFLTGVFLFIYIYFQMQKPVYSGTSEMPNLKAEVKVYFDNYGIPHIYGQNEEDVFRVLGYVHAKERLFQMEIVRRVSSGRLSEIFGSKTLETDKFFRMLGINKRAEDAAKKFMLNTDEPWKKSMLAYVDGVNHFIETKRRRFEFLLLGIPKEKFTIKDVYLIADFMSYNFQQAFKTDPLMTRINKKWGEKYMSDIGMETKYQVKDTSATILIDSVFTSIEDLLPVKIWSGSNSLAISAEKSESGKVLFENDTHIGVQQPAAWYEAHLDCPGFSIYGSFLAGFPFPALGHNLNHAWGLTILENDDLDFYAEQVNPSDTTLIKRNDQWEKISVRNEIIYVKDSTAIILPCRTTSHGPICSDVLPEFAATTAAPVSVCWTLLKFPANLPEVTWNMSHACSLDDFRHAVSAIAAPGLNVIYGDAQNNIAWYAAAKIVKRRPDINPNLILDGSGPEDWLGYYDFSENPQQENPPRGVVLSANNPPSTDSVPFFAGYYTPVDRLIRINQLLHSKKIFSIRDVQKINTDNINPICEKNAQVMLEGLPAVSKLKSQIHQRAAEILDQWNGSHDLTDIAPVIYYKWLYHVLENTLADELGEQDFQAFLKTHALKCSIHTLLQNDTSLWWDNANTKEVIESKALILSQSYDSTIVELIKQLGPDPSQWLWKKVHKMKIEHIIGKQKPLDELFNLGPYPAPGGFETVNNQGFDLNSHGEYFVNLAPALRRTLDFATPETGYNISPSGQSGNFMSRNYNNQSKLYLNGNVRKEMLNRKEIENTYNGRLIFTPPN